MKTRTVYLIAVLLSLVVIVMAACAPAPGDALQNAQNKGGADPNVTNYVERRNIQWKIQVQDRNNTILWCTFFSQTGSPITTIAVLNKITSGNKRLDPATTVGTVTGNVFQFQLAGDTSQYYTSEVPGADGTFGSSNPYEFGFTPEGIDGYFQTSLPYFCSLKPQTWQAPTVNVVTDEGLAAKQLQAEQALKTGKCVDSQLNVVDCSTQTQPAPVPAVPQPAAPQPTP